MTNTLDTRSLVPVLAQPKIALGGSTIDQFDALAPVLTPLGYGVISKALEPGANLINTPLILWGATNPEAADLAAIAQLGQAAAYQEATLINFCRLDPAIAALWGSLDDGVMGGVSTSQIQWQGGLRFSGQVSTANSGGFASIRTRNLEPPLNLSQWQGTVLHAQGDGQRYKWILRDNPGWDSLAYCRSFDTEATGSNVIRTSFLDMVATRRARTVPEASPLNPAQLYSMQLMLSKFEYDGDLNPAFSPGDFELTVQSLGVYRQGAKPVIVLPKSSPEMVAQLKVAGLTGVVPHNQSFAVIGASTGLPPEIPIAVIEQILQTLRQSD
ncbi:CIA30 family protein [Nodosilinea sp. LEGE 07088]|uniref:CIA30 family protein n=1 Tax=Nodosilinea sp. LEGE 07088 TaxID=2777968 RepID=UPI0018816FF1|nr:CIA30 family protein [Nodosilinea sp. LEGE 07088]MBE9135933.1 CIA30 family protein [Nodosilinea sp. LEGE 07088]